MALSLVSNNTILAGAKIGENVLVHLVTGKIEKVMFNGLARNGIEGFHLDLNSKPLTFYPYTSIIKVTKYTEIT